MKAYSVILYVNFILVVTYAQKDVEGLGPCPTVTSLMTDFTETDYAGTWYEVKSYENTLIPGECGLIVHTLKDKEFQVNYVSYIADSKSNETLLFTLKPVDKTKADGKYEIQLKDKHETIPYEVLYTDYKKYSIVYSCSFNPNNKHIQRLFILSRTNTLKDATEKEMETKLETLKLDKSKLKSVEQDDKKCGRSAATSIILPSFFSLILVTLLCK